MANLGIIGKINKIFSKTKNTPIGPENTKGKTTETSPGDMSQTGLSPILWRTSDDRRSTYIDVENMDENDEIISQALDTVADTATGLEDDNVEGFYLVTDNQRVKDILEELFIRTDLKWKAWDIIRKTVKHGNEFREIIIGADSDGQWKILSLKEDLPCWQFYANIDEFGRLNYEYPWIQKSHQTLVNPDIVKFRPWQLVHWSYGPTKNSVAVPLLKSARRNWKRLQVVEDTMALARMIRAYLKLVHKVPVPETKDTNIWKTAIQKYKELMQKKDFLNWTSGQKNTMDNPFTVETDFYLPDDGSGRGGIEAIDPKNANLQNIDDVQYALNRIISRLGVPRKYLNVESPGNSSLNQGNGDHEEKHFARKIRGIQSSFKRGAMFICNIELLLHGINPIRKENKFTIGMSKVNSDDEYRLSQSYNTMADAAKKWVEIAEIPDALLRKKFLKLNDFDEEQYGKQIKIRTKPNPALMGNNHGGAPSGTRPGSNGPNGTIPGRQKRNESVLSIRESTTNE